MKKIYNYRCRGYSFGTNNEHLLGCVGDIHTLDSWLKIVFRNKYEDSISYFEGWKDNEIIKYLFTNFKIRLEKER